MINLLYSAHNFGRHEFYDYYDYDSGVDSFDVISYTFIGLGVIVVIANIIYFSYIGLKKLWHWISSFKIWKYITMPFVLVGGVIWLLVEEIKTSFQESIWKGIVTILKLLAYTLGLLYFLLMVVMAVAPLIGAMSLLVNLIQGLAIHFLN